MKDLSEWLGKLGKLTGLFQKYKYVLLVILVGAALLLLPELGGADNQPAAAAGTQSSSFDVEDTERRLAQVLSQIDGAGEVSVMLTVEGGTRQVLAQDTTSAQDEGGSEASRTTVVLSQGSGVQQAVPLQQLSPQFRGALVVCSGGDDPQVRLALTQAVAALTGLGADRISVCPGR